MRPILVLAGLLAYLLLALGLRIALQRRATGHSGFQGIEGAPLSIGWFAGVSFIVAIALSAAAPLLGIAGLDHAFFTPSTAGDVAGVALLAIGTGGTWWAQSAM